MAISVVQSKVIDSALSGSFDSPTTAGNCVVVIVNATHGSSLTPSVTGVTLGGSADNFAEGAKGVNTTGSIRTIASIWADQDCAGGQSAVAVSGSNLSTVSGVGGIILLEISGVLASSAVDVHSGGQGTSGTTWSSGGGTTTQASEIWVGADTSANFLLTPPASWTNLYHGGTTGAPGGGYKIVSATGAAPYAGTLAASDTWTAAVVTLKAVTSTTWAIAGTAASASAAAGSLAWLAAPSGTAVSVSAAAGAISRRLEADGSAANASVTAGDLAWHTPVAGTAASASAAAGDFAWVIAPAGAAASASATAGDFTWLATFSGDAASVSSATDGLAQIRELTADPAASVSATAGDLIDFSPENVAMLASAQAVTSGSASSSLSVPVPSGVSAGDLILIWAAAAS